MEIKSNLYADNQRYNLITAKNKMMAKKNRNEIEN